jgi:hypothetical protein
VGKRGHCKSIGFYFFYGIRNVNHQLGTGFFVHHRKVSTIKTVEFVSDRMSCLVLKGHWFNIIVLNWHARTEEKNEDSKHSFMRNSSRISITFPSTM